MLEEFSIHVKSHSKAARGVFSCVDSAEDIPFLVPGALDASVECTFDPPTHLEPGTYGFNVQLQPPDDAVFEDIEDADVWILLATPVVASSSKLELGDGGSV